MKHQKPKKNVKLTKMQVSNEITEMMIRYIQGVCGLSIYEHQFGTVMYVQHYQNGSVNVDVKKYALPANAFLMVVQEHQHDCLTESVTIPGPGYESKEDILVMYYCIGDMSSKLLPYIRESGEPDLDTGTGPLADSEYTHILIFNYSSGDDMLCERSLLKEDLLDVIGQTPDRPDLADELCISGKYYIDNRRRLKKHFEDLCGLCVEHTDISQVVDQSRLRSGRFPGHVSSSREFVRKMSENEQLRVFEKLLVDEAASISDVGKSVFRSRSKKFLRAALD